MKIRLIGKRNNLGIGVHFTHFADSLRLRWSGEVQELDLEDQAALQTAARESQPDDINISFVGMELEQHFRGHNIQWIVFESTLIPEIINHVLRGSQWVWVPSQWGQDILLANGIAAHKIDIVPEGVDPNQFQPCGIQTSEPFRFLTVGKAERRKSLAETMLAFSQTFGSDPAVELVVKTDHFYYADAKRQELTEFATRIGGRIRIEWGAWSKEHIRDLYHACHVFVFPSKGEGWGLPLIEALASGMPAVATAYSAQRDFLADCASSVIPVEYDMVPVDCEEYRLFYQLQGQLMGEWAQPRVASIGQGMRLARENYTALKSAALENSRIIRGRWNWVASVDHALKTLHDRGLLSG